MMINLNLLPAYIIGGCVGAVAGYLGTLMLSKRMALMGGPLGHLTLPGITLALIYGFDVSLGALLFVIFGIILIWILEKKTKIPTEAITAVVFSSSLAIAFLFLPKGKSSQALLGDISKISWLTTIITALTTIIIFFITHKIYNKIVLANISEDLAKVEGIKIGLCNFIYLSCIAVTVALSVRIVGGLMTAAIVAIPACTSRNITKNLKQYSYLGLILGGMSCKIGIMISAHTSTPVGPMIIISSATLFLISLIFKK